MAVLFLYCWAIFPGVVRAESPGQRVDDMLHLNRMLGSQNHEGGPEDGVGTGGENPNGIVALHREVHLGAFGAPDPVALRGGGSGGPVHHSRVVEIGQ